MTLHSVWKWNTPFALSCQGIDRCYATDYWISRNKCISG